VDVIAQEIWAVKLFLREEPGEGFAQGIEEFPMEGAQAQKMA
jgi:hypothetical protein